MKHSAQKLLAAALLLILFVLWTVAVCTVDVQPIGPEGSSVGMAKLNQWIHQWTGVHMDLYLLTDWLSIIPLGLCMGFGLLGLVQCIRRKSLLRVDRDLLLLGGFYAVVIAFFLLFEKLTLNYRPVLIEGKLEASYPSSTTLLVLCVFATAIMQFRTRIHQPVLRRTACFLAAALMVFMAVGRLISGVHWFSDIVGSVLLSTGLVILYAVICSKAAQKS